MRIGKKRKEKKRAKQLEAKKLALAAGVMIALAGLKKKRHATKHRPKDEQ
jgi:hypothetical protein